MINILARTGVPIEVVLVGLFLHKKQLDVKSPGCVLTIPKESDPKCEVSYLAPKNCILLTFPPALTHTSRFLATIK